MNNKSIIILKLIMSWNYDCILLFTIALCGNFGHDYTFVTTIIFLWIYLDDKAQDILHTLVFNFSLFSSLNSSIYIPYVTFFECAFKSVLICEFHCCTWLNSHTNTYKLLSFVLWCWWRFHHLVHPPIIAAIYEIWPNFINFFS